MFSNVRQCARKSWAEWHGLGLKLGVVKADYEQRLSASSFANKMAQPNYSYASACVCVCVTWRQVVREKNA